MTVKELLKVLAKCDLNATVVLSKDAEGNGYHELATVENNLLYNQYQGTCGDVEGTPAIVLWPFD